MIHLINDIYTYFQYLNTDSIKEELIEIGIKVF